MDYSKWDKIELSDDSDIEEHPNIDKGSMIRWKQAKIHRDRRDRRDKIEATKREIELNKKAFALLAQSPFGKERRGDGTSSNISTKEDITKVLNVFGFTFNAAEAEFREFFDDMRFADWNDRWGPPSLIDFVEQRIRYEEWVRSQLCKLGVEEAANATDADGKAIPKPKDFGIWKDFSATQLVSLLQDEVSALQKRIMERNEKCAKEVEHDEKESMKKLTSENIGKVTKDSSKISKPKPANVANGSKGQVIETIHDPSAPKILNSVNDSVEVAKPAVEGDLTTLPFLDEFSKLKSIQESADFVRDHMSIIHTDYNSGLLSLAFRAETKGDKARAKQCIHQATIVNYCKEMGPANTPMFFKRIIGNKEALSVFMNDVNDTYGRLSFRVDELKKKERKEELEEERLNEARLQLATQDDGSILWPIVEGQNDNDAEFEKKKVFDSLPHDFKKALILQDVDGINKYLSSLPKDELEAKVQECTKVGIIQLEERED